MWINGRLIASGQTGQKPLAFKYEQVRNIAFSPLSGLYILLLFHITIKLNDLPLWYTLNWEKIITSLLQYAVVLLLQMIEINFGHVCKKSPSWGLISWEICSYPCFDPFYQGCFLLLSKEKNTADKMWTQRGTFSRVTGRAAWSMKKEEKNPKNRARKYNLICGLWVA